MIGLLPTTTIFLATAPTDLRKAYDGLAVLVRQSLGQDPLSGSLYVFCNRRRDRIKILFWEEGGYWLCARRLEQGTFRWPRPVRFGGCGIHDTPLLEAPCGQRPIA
jgi:transposase